MASDKVMIRVRVLGEEKFRIPGLPTSGATAVGRAHRRLLRSPAAEEASAESPAHSDGLASLPENECSQRSPLTALKLGTPWRKMA